MKSIFLQLNEIELNKLLKNKKDPIHKKIPSVKSITEMYMGITHIETKEPLSGNKFLFEAKFTENTDTLTIYPTRNKPIVEDKYQYTIDLKKKVNKLFEHHDDGTDQFCPNCGGAMKGQDDETFYCERCNKSWDWSELNDLDENTLEIDKNCPNCNSPMIKKENGKYWCGRCQKNYDESSIDKYRDDGYLGPDKDHDLDYLDESKNNSHVDVKKDKIIVYQKFLTGSILDNYEVTTTIRFKNGVVQDIYENDTSRHGGSGYIYFIGDGYEELKDKLRDVENVPGFKEAFKKMKKVDKDKTVGLKDLDSLDETKSNIKYDIRDSSDEDDNFKESIKSEAEDFNVDGITVTKVSARLSGYKNNVYISFSNGESINYQAKWDAFGDSKGQYFECWIQNKNKILKTFKLNSNHLTGVGTLGEFLLDKYTSYLKGKGKIKENTEDVVGYDMECPDCGHTWDVDVNDTGLEPFDTPCPGCGNEVSSDFGTPLYGKVDNKMNETVSQSEDVIKHVKNGMGWITDYSLYQNSYNYKIEDDASIYDAMVSLARHGMLHDEDKLVSRDKPTDQSKMKPSDVKKKWAYKLGIKDEKKIDEVSTPGGTLFNALSLLGTGIKFGARSDGKTLDGVKFKDAELKKFKLKGKPKKGIKVDTTDGKTIYFLEPFDIKTYPENGKQLFFTCGGIYPVSTSINEQTEKKMNKTQQTRKFMNRLNESFEGFNGVVSLGAINSPLKETYSDYDFMKGIDTYEFNGTSDMFRDMLDAFEGSDALVDKSYSEKTITVKKGTDLESIVPGFIDNLEKISD